MYVFEKMKTYRTRLIVYFVHCSQIKVAFMCEHANKNPGSRIECGTEGFSDRSPSNLPSIGHSDSRDMSQGGV